MKRAKVGLVWFLWFSYQEPVIIDLEDNEGVDKFWYTAGQSELDKRRSSVQLTMSVGGTTRLPPLIVFRGKALCINAE